jgi:sulfur-oxidizing protein SoxY
MNNRRDTLKQGAVLAGLLTAAGYPQYALAFNKNAFEAKTVQEAMSESKDVTLTGPDIAENGAVVPLGVSTNLSGVRELLILVEKNPNVLVALFKVNDAIDANFMTRAKMGQSSDVFAVAIMNDGRALFSKKEVKVTLGGCGG